MSTAGNTVHEDAGGIRSAEIVDGRLHLFLNSGLAALEAGRRRILQHFEPERLPPPVINRLEVIFEEVVANIIRHNLAGNSGKLILVIASASPGTIELVFEDEGTPFNPLDVPAPARFESLKSVRVGGLGIHLMKKLSATARYKALSPGDVARWIGKQKFCPANRLTLSIANSGRDMAY